MNFNKNSYDHAKIEKKWQKYWDKKKIFRAKDPKKGKNEALQKKFYGLIEFPYPSGDGLHVGHIRSNTAMDIISHKRRREGFNVLYPIGWDAFGLPTENYAIKTGIQPAIVTKNNTNIFRKQLKSLGFTFDWSREINTTDPNYYKWTQWIFLQFFKKGLAYKKKMKINWCPKDLIGLANEEVIDGKCERCGTPVEEREKEQWMLAITKYAERLDKDLDEVDFLPQIKTQQRNWIGKSEGAEIEFEIKNRKEKIKIFTTRPDTIYGVTYLVLSPGHPLSNGIKEGELVGVKAINPANKEEIPIRVADYVLADYGTGAIMAVPAHDERDWDFAKKNGLGIRQVIAPYATGDENDKDKVRIDKKTVTRKTAYAFLLDKKNNRFLCLDWEKFNWHSGIIGGVDEGETYREAAIREIKEETGYINIKFIKELGGEQHNHYFAAHKDENRYAIGQGLLFELMDEEKIPVEEEHTRNHKPIWIKNSDMSKWINLSAFKYMWEAYENGYNYFLGNGKIINSGKFDGKKSDEIMKEITEYVGGTWVTKFKLRDWIFSRQRYWGEPIPIVHCEKCGIVSVPEEQLPIKLPKVKNYKPTETGESPLALITKWVNTKCPKCKGKAKRETDTMPNWAGSSWYYLRYADPKNKKAFASKENLEYFTPVDWYNGGMEHTTLHLLYSRFWHKFLFDLGLVPTSEPYKKRTSHGLILALGGEKMSKSKGNVINPDNIVANVGADALRLYEMFMGPFDQAISWDENGIVGTRRFVERVWKLKEKVGDTKENLENIIHKTIKKVSEDIEEMKFNTAVSSLMILVNEFEKQEKISKENYSILLSLLAPFAPHITEELWQKTGNKISIHTIPWPIYDKNKIKETLVNIVVQINGKVRGSFQANVNENEDAIKKMALNMPEIVKWIDGKEPKKIIIVKDKLINFVL